MMIAVQKKTVYKVLFILIALCQLYVESFRFNIFLQLGIIGFCHFLEPIQFHTKLYQHLVTVMLLMLAGFIGAAIYGHSLPDILKDVFHFIKPLNGLLLGYILFRRIGNFKAFAHTIVVAAIITAVLHLFIVFFLTNFLSGSIEAIRYYTKDNFLEIFAIFLLIYFPRFEGVGIFDKQAYKWIGLIVLLISSLLYFSRTMIVIAGIIWLTVNGYTRITQRGLRAIGIMTIMVCGLYIYLYNTNIKRGATGLEGLLYKVKIIPEELFTYNIDRQNHADLWDHWRGYEAKRAIELMNEHPLSYIVGNGHGSLIDLKFYAPLTGNKKGIRFISDLHNGYMYIFYKTGIIGLLIYLFLLIRWYCYIYKARNLKNGLISASGLIFLTTTIMITGIYNSKDIIIFITGAMFGCLCIKRNHKPA